MRKESKKPYNTKSKTTLVFLNCEGFSNHIIKLWAKHPNLIRQKAKQPLYSTDCIFNGLRINSPKVPC